MNSKNILLGVALSTLLSGCGSIKSPITQQYQLTAFGTVKSAQPQRKVTLMVTPTEAVNGYQTEQMQYTTEAYTLHSFAKNAWVSPPATMIYTLMLQSLQESHYFSAIASSVYMSKTQYRLDTQLLKLQQNFTQKPSILELEVKATLTNVSNNQIIASRTFKQRVPCPKDSPEGGAFAANKATARLTKAITQFAIREASAF